MSMRTHTLVTHLRPDDALALIEWVMLQETTREQTGIRQEDVPF